MSSISDGILFVAEIFKDADLNRRIAKKKFFSKKTEGQRAAKAASTHTIQSRISRLVARCDTRREPRGFGASQAPTRCFCITKTYLVT